MVIRRLDVYLVNLDPTIGHEIKKTRPCLIISPDEMNWSASTVIIAPMTTKSRPYPTRIACTFQSKKGEIVLDQIRSIDKARLITRLGEISKTTGEKVLESLGELFAP